jgi:hypothetical protein
MIPILFIVLALLSSCVDTGYQPSYIISHDEEVKEAPILEDKSLH